MCTARSSSSVTQRAMRTPHDGHRCLSIHSYLRGRIGENSHGNDLDCGTTTAISSERIWTFACARNFDETCSSFSYPVLKLDLGS